MLAIGWVFFYFFIRQTYAPAAVSPAQYAFLAGYTFLLALSLSVGTTRFLRREGGWSWLDTRGKRIGAYFAGTFVLEAIVFALPFPPFYRNVLGHSAYFLLIPLFLNAQGGRLQRWLEVPRTPGSVAADGALDELILTPTRRKAVFVILGGTAFVAAGWFLRVQSPVVAWICIVFFGLGIVAGLLMLLPGFSRLTVRREDFTIRHSWRSFTFRWDQIADLTVVGGLQGPRVAWNVMRSEGRRSVFLRETYGRDMMLMDSYGLPAEALCELMRARQASCGTRAS